MKSYGRFTWKFSIFWNLTAGDNSNDHLRLQTLWCDEGLDLSRIIRSQTELQMLGIHEYSNDNFGFLKILKELQNAQVHLPVVFALDYGYDEVFHRISIFPGFYDCHPAIHQVLAESFDEDQGSINAGAIDAYLVDPCDLPSIQVLTKNLTMTFPDITSLTFYADYPYEIVSFLLTMVVTVN